MHLSKLFNHEFCQWQTECFPAIFPLMIMFSVSLFSMNFSSADYVCDLYPVKNISICYFLRPWYFQNSTINVHFENFQQFPRGRFKRLVFAAIRSDGEQVAFKLLYFKTDGQYLDKEISLISIKADLACLIRDRISFLDVSSQSRIISRYLNEETCFIFDVSMDML